MISLKKIAEDVASQFTDCNGNDTVNERTLRRRFEKLVNGCGGDFEKLKNKNGKVLFDEDDVPFIKSLLYELADKESLSYRVLSGINEEILPVEDVDAYIHDYIQLNIDHMEEYNWHEEDIKCMVMVFDLLFEHSVRVKRTYCHQLIDYLDYNNQVYPMTFRLEFLSRIEMYLKQEFARATVESLYYVGELASLLKSSKDLTENIDYGDDEIALEYEQRDRKVWELIQKDPLVKNYVETKTGVKVEELFSHIIEN